MKNLESLKNLGQESLAHLVDLGKQQTAQVQMWGVTAAAAVAGALVLTATAKGVVGIVTTLANPPLALTAGALGGGLWGWSFMQRHQQPTASAAPDTPEVADAAVADIPIRSESSDVTA